MAGAKPQIGLLKTSDNGDAYFQNIYGTKFLCYYKSLRDILQPKIFLQENERIM